LTSTEHLSIPWTCTRRHGRRPCNNSANVFDDTLKRLGGIDPSKVIVVGDTPHDVVAASKARLLTVGMLCGGFPESELLAAGCIAIYCDPEALLTGYIDSPLH